MCTRTGTHAPTHTTCLSVSYVCFTLWFSPKVSRGHGFPPASAVCLLPPAPPPLHLPLAPSISPLLRFGLLVKAITFPLMWDVPFTPYGKGMAARRSIEARLRQQMAVSTYALYI